VSDQGSAEAGREFAHLMDIMRRLRRECPWDREQDHWSLRAFLLEEAYELLEALDREHQSELCEELGDLALQVVFHAVIAEEAREFDVGDVLRGINEKLVRRHPHVFAGAEAPTGADVHLRWEHIKRAQEDKSSLLGGVPRELPALLKAARVLAKLRQNGLGIFEATDTASEAGRWLHALSGAAERGDAEEAGRAAGMLCLAVAELTDRAGGNAEDALRETLARLAGAFGQDEEELRRDGLHVADLPGQQRRQIAARLLERCEEE
jgi:tetrapyrrole methylase family protein/MazG family protein